MNCYLGIHNALDIRLILPADSVLNILNGIPGALMSLVRRFISGRARQRRTFFELKEWRDHAALIFPRRVGVCGESRMLLWEANDLASIPR